MPLDGRESYPLLEYPTLAEVAIALRDAGHWGSVVDDRWRLVYVTDELRLTIGGHKELAAFAIGKHEANEAARIEACASGGRALASKALIERLDAHDAAALGIDPTRTGYTLLADLPTATEKARRDASAMAVCDLVE